MTFEKEGLVLKVFMQFAKKEMYASRRRIFMYFQIVQISTYHTNEDIFM